MDNFSLEKKVDNLLEKNGLSRKELAKELGISPQLLSVYLNLKREMPLRILKRVANYLGTTVAYLLGEQTSASVLQQLESSQNIKLQAFKMLLDTAPKEAVKHLEDEMKKLTENFANIPVYASVSCGEGVPIISEDKIITYVQLPKEEKENLSICGGFYCRGNSMEGFNIFDGDLIFIQKIFSASEGDYVLLQSGCDLMLKKCIVIGDRKILIDSNYNYFEEMDSLILGRIVLLWRYYGRG